ncbi:GNAT family N-acetyltransferase [Nocardioides sp. zg-1228]|uniref:GNAT family N-acetyltransferase n=1 Tax=Nocardioides sp. zg-1228 TaxID=2763008 RepID=UPI0016433708|nr:GNAT family N-acetyltransferase [Nocardioides sp. zg-1228]MBC2932246.1 GNAT family N-acetyltransferase [Nocardioides sp. zg-1228]QSF57773.1 GNAT family N-acetyltransferase [Nocardioides sp. zg-1228]
MGDDTLTDPVHGGLRNEVRDRFVAVNGDHAMSSEDDAYVREHFVEAPPGATRLMLDGRLPLPSYVLGDGTAMVPADHGRLAELAGGLDRLHDWFVAFWEGDEAAGEREWQAYLSGQHAGLREVSPVRIRQVAERVAEARAALDLLRRDPHDPIGRGMLGEAVDGVIAVPGLDAMLLPMTAYDRLRAGGPTIRERWVDAPRAAYLTPAPPVWPLRTERLLLRPHELGDADAFVTAWGSEEWTSLLLSRPMNRAEVVEMVRRRTERGDGTFLGLAVTTLDGTVVGDSILHLQGTGLSEAEIGWTVLPEHAGRGYATEAARAVLRLGFEHYGLRRIMANLDVRNERSAALCERLGMRREVHRIADFWSKGEWTSSYEYALLREEWRAARG